MATLKPTVRLVCDDEEMSHWLGGLAPPAVRIVPAASLCAVTREPVPPGSVTVLVTEELNTLQAGRVEAFLAERPCRFAILCRQVEPGALYDLVRAAAPLGLVDIDSIGDEERVSRKLRRWSHGAVVRPDWTKLGIGEEERPCEIVLRLMRLVERRPFRDWRARDVAHRLGVSERTLGRAVRDSCGCTTKSLLIVVRGQLIESVEALGWLSRSEVAELFGFESPKEMDRWRRVHGDEPGPSR